MQPGQKLEHRKQNIHHFCVVTSQQRLIFLEPFSPVFALLLFQTRSNRRKVYISKHIDWNEYELLSFGIGSSIIQNHYYHSKAN